MPLERGIQPTKQTRPTTSPQLKTTHGCPAVSWLFKEQCTEIPCALGLHLPCIPIGCSHEPGFVLFRREHTSCPVRNRQPHTQHLILHQGVFCGPHLARQTIQLASRTAQIKTGVRQGLRTSSDELQEVSNVF